MVLLYRHYTVSSADGDLLCVRAAFVALQVGTADMHSRIAGDASLRGRLL